jgi:hypothetical protein
MKTLSIIIATAALGGAAYGQPAGSLEWLQQRNAEREIAAQREMLEELQAQQRQIHYELENRQLFEEQRCRSVPFWVRPLELECE